MAEAGNTEAANGVMTSYEYLDSAKFQPSDAEVRTRRPAAAL
jgi:hypothetical protein